jgi:outer membrane protein OmpA-like peptidoglycan-associated protein
MRADRVVAELVNLGVPQDRIQVLGRGQAPFVDVPLEARRVEIHIGPN